MDRRSLSVLCAECFSSPARAGSLLPRRHLLVSPVARGTTDRALGSPCGAYYFFFERRARIAADHAGGVIAAQRRDRARLGRRLGWLRDLPDARRASASVPGRRRARSAAHRLRARAGRRRAAIDTAIQHFGEQHRRLWRSRGISRPHSLASFAETLSIYLLSFFTYIFACVRQQ